MAGDITFVSAKNAKINQQTMSFGAAEVSKNFTVSSSPAERGRLSRCFLVIPNWTNAVTATLTITDEDSNTLYSKASLARNQTHDLRGLDAVVAETVTVTVQLSGVPGGTGGDVLCSFYVSDSADYITNITTGEMVVDLGAIEGADPQLDGTNKLGVSCYGADSSPGDTAMAVESGGEQKVSLYATDAAAADVGVKADSAGQLMIDVQKIDGQDPQLDNTNKLGVSLWGADVAAGDTAVHVDSAGDLQVDVLSGTTDIEVGGTAPQLDDTDKLASSLWAKQTNPGDTAVLVDATGHLQVDVLSTTGTANVNVAQFGGTNVQLDDTDKPAISLWGKDTNPGDTAIAVDSNGRVKSQHFKVGTTNVTADLVANSTNPTEIDTSGSSTMMLCLIIKEDGRFCVAVDQATANTSIASDTSSAILDAGYHEFPIYNMTDKFYIRSNDASLLTDGLRYWMLEV